MSRGILISLEVVLGIVIAVLAQAIAVPESLKPYVVPLVVILVIGLVWVTSRQARPEHPSNFPTLWSTLSASLRRDIEYSHQSIVEARRATQLDYGYEVQLVQEPDFPLYRIHLSTVTNYDKELAKALRDYMNLAKQLRDAKTAYNRLVYADQPDEQALADARNAMYQASRRLETLIDEQLQWRVIQYDNEIGAGQPKPSADR